MKALMFMAALTVAERAVRVMQWLGSDTDELTFERDLPNGRLEFTVGRPDCAMCRYDLPHGPCNVTPEDLEV